MRARRARPRTTATRGSWATRATFRRRSGWATSAAGRGSTRGRTCTAGRSPVPRTRFRSGTSTCGWPRPAAPRATSTRPTDTPSTAASSTTTTGTSLTRTTTRPRPRRRPRTTTATRRALVAGAVVAAAVGVCVACAWVDDSPVAAVAGGHPDGDRVWGRVFLVALALGFAAYLGGLWLLRGGGTVRPVLALACAIQLAPLAAPLLLSTDAWSYWAYAKVDNPYRDTPAEAGEAGRYAGEAWSDKTSVYGPAFSLASEPLAAVDSPDVTAWTYKAAAAAAVLLAALLTARRSSRGAFAAAFVGWNPVLAVHFAGGGHNDALMMALVVSALALGPTRPRVAGVAWAVAALVKWVPLLLLPLHA